MLKYMYRSERCCERYIDYLQSSSGAFPFEKTLAGQQFEKIGKQPSHQQLGPHMSTPPAGYSTTRPQNSPLHVLSVVSVFVGIDLNMNIVLHMYPR